MFAPDRPRARNAQVPLRGSTPAVQPANLASMFAYGCRADPHALASNPVDGTDNRRQPPPASLDYYEVDEVEALAVAC